MFWGGWRVPSPLTLGHSQRHYLYVTATLKNSPTTKRWCRRKVSNLPLKIFSLALIRLSYSGKVVDRAGFEPSLGTLKGC